MLRIKKWAKKAVGHPEDDVPVVSVADWVKGHVGNPQQGIIGYFKSLFPVFQWIGNYNLGWATGDLIAGLTVGIILVPQSMSYAKIATLPAEYGLYSSFVGVFVYCFFATSKDVSIGPVAVMSLEIAQIVKNVTDVYGDRWSSPQIAVTVAFICGFIVLGIGLLRIGRIVEFIPAPAVSGFMTGSAITIVSSQIPSLLGISSLFDTRGSAYLVIINTLKNLRFSTKDAAFGVMGLFTLYLIRGIFEVLTKRYPAHSRAFFFGSVLRNAFVIVILTAAAYGYAKDKVDSKGNYPISVLKTVPRGFKQPTQPYIDPALLAALAPDIPVATIILLLEHIAISKSFGRLNGYKINPNQELIAIGVTNTVGTVFWAYPATGSFSRSALKSKCGVRTPAAGWVTGLVVIVALYGLTDAFFWIPLAGLSAIIIHAVADLVTPPAQVYSYWRISPLEFLIWLATVLVSIFATIDIGIYVSVASSVFLLLLRVALPGGEFLGKVTVHTEGDPRSREIYLPLSRNKDITSPDINVESPTPGILIYRLEESFTFPNSTLINSNLVDYAQQVTRTGRDISSISLYDRPWNDTGPRHPLPVDPAANNKPLLHAVVLDFSAVAHIDTTGIQNLYDTRQELEKWAGQPVEFRFANILSPWVRRALIAGGFGYGTLDRSYPREIAPVVPEQNEAFGGSGDGGYSGPTPPSPRKTDLEDMGGTKSDSTEGPIIDLATPFFHVDLNSAVRAAERSLLTKARGS